MLVLFGIMVLLVAAFGFSVIWILRNDSEYIVSTAIIGGIVAVLIMGGIFCIVEHFCPSISPMDVYRGKTTLEITYRDSIAIDSTVIWKDKRE